MNLYNTSALFKQNMSEIQQDRLLNHFKEVFTQYEIKNIHDCSIGAGGTTIPLAKLGYEISGSDISGNLLNQAARNFSNSGFSVELFQADFRNIHQKLNRKYDCIISTGNSLPHINNEDVDNFVKNISNKLNDSGLLYIDMRNWDKILADKPLFTARDPKIMTAERHLSLYQIWNWHDDESVNFIFVTSEDRKGKHYKTEKLLAPTYYPLKLADYKKTLRKYNFEILDLYDLDNIWLSSSEEKNKNGNFEEDFPKINWYAVLARKI